MSEPATPDPKHIRNTVLILVGIMLISGIFVTYAYRQTLKAQSETQRAPFVGKLTDQFAAKNRFDKPVSTGDLLNKVWLVASISVKNPEPGLPAIEAMKRLAESQPPDQQPNFLIISPDFENEEISDLAAFAETYQIPTENWQIVREEEANKFIAGPLKLTAPHKANEEEQKAGYGKIKYDPRIVIVDREMHLRGYIDDNGTPKNYFNYTEIAGDSEKTRQLDQKLSQTFTELNETKKPDKPNFVGVVIGVTIFVTFFVVIIGKRRQGITK